MRHALVSLVLLALTEAGCTTTGAVPPTRALVERGQALIAQGEMAAATIPLREALRREPDSLDARSSLGLALYAMGDVDAAVEELRGLLRQHPDAVQARLTLATALMARREWPAAQRELAEVIQREPDHIQAHYSLGVVRYAQGDLDGAAAAYRRVLARSPDHHDARYNLALMLKLAHQDAAATPEFLAAARAGLARAQFFAGTAYAGGLGVERDLVQAIAWWMRASEQGVIQADDALAELRQIARGRSRHAAAERQAVQDAFRDYRETLWQPYPGLRRSGDDTVGGALLRDGRVAEAVPVLLREAQALSEPAERLLETIYERGVEGKLAAYDPRIRGVLQELSAATQGSPTPVRP